MKGHPIPSDIIKQLIKKAERTHKTYSEVAREYGISPSVISRYRMLNGDIVRQHRTITEEQIKEIRHRYIELRQSGPQISKDMSIAHSFIYEIIGKGNRGLPAHKRLGMSLAQEGKRMGKDNPNYRGGHTKCNHKSSFFLDEWKKQVWQRDGGKCKRCGGNEELEAHHIISMADPRCDENPLLMVRIENGILLCRKCHGPTAHRESSFEDECKQLLEKCG